jgi:hypothetical protein
MNMRIHLFVKMIMSAELVTGGAIEVHVTQVAYLRLSTAGPRSRERETPSHTGLRNYGTNPRNGRPASHTGLWNGGRKPAQIF